MHASSVSESTSASRFARINWRWRVVDIVVASVLGVACGLMFYLWNIGYLGPSAIFEAALPGLQGFVDGPWLIAGVLGGLVIRKPGAALFTETLAASVSALIGTQWGAGTIASGLIQGLGAEIVFLLFAYGVWTLGVAVLAGAGAAVGGATLNLLSYYAGAGLQFTLTYFTCSVISGAVVAGLGSWLITKALAQTGALDRFPSGRSQQVRV